MSAGTAFICGLVVGLAAGVCLKDAWLIVHAKVTRRHVDTPDGRPSRRFYALASLVVLLAAAQVAIGALALVTRTRVSDQVSEFATFARCQASFNQELSESSSPVRVATIERDNALTAYIDFAAQFMDGTAPTDAQRAHGKGLFTALRDASRHLTKVRASNPLPPPPEQTCGSPPSG